MILVVPSLENYELDLLSLGHGDEPYPVFAQLKDDIAEHLESEQELIDWLRSAALSSPTTRRAIDSLRSLVE